MENQSSKQFLLQLLLKTLIRKQAKNLNTQTVEIQGNIGQNNKNIDWLYLKAKTRNKKRLFHDSNPKHNLSMLDSISRSDLLVFKLTSDVTKACIFLKVSFEGSYINDVSYCIAKISQKICKFSHQYIYMCRALSYFRFRY